MTRTLADMTPAERADCVGRWCEHGDYGLVILADPNGNAGVAVVIVPVTGGWCWAKESSLTPRLDLPRAWTPSGEPAPARGTTIAGTTTCAASGPSGSGSMTPSAHHRPAHQGDTMSHADTLRGMADAFTVVGSRERVDTCLAGAEALDAVERVRHALSRIACRKADTEYSRGHDDFAEWYAATADALEYVIDLLTEALEGETE